MTLEFLLLGNVEAVRNGKPLVLGPARPRSVLVALLLDVNSPVSLTELAWRVWGEKAPKQARGSLHSYFTRLRTAMGVGADITRRGHGYALHVDRRAVDVHRFRDAVVRARKTGQPAEAVRRFDEALALWRGEPFAGLESPWLDAARAALEAERESVLLDRVDLLLELGQHAQLVADLEVRANRYPLDERLAAQLILALYRNGRQAEALLRFHKVKTVLADELGVGPGMALRTLYQAILREDSVLDVSPPPGDPVVIANATLESDRPEPAPDEWTRAIARQLPAMPQSFVGRRAELENLSANLGGANRTASAPISIVVGPGGIGKTWLALYWAHQHVDLFPDGQLFIDLRGLEPSAGSPSPCGAMRSVLLALGFPPESLPGDPEAMTGLYRTALADKRLLLVIDNASAMEQVTPLLPGARGSSVIVTSRNRLTSLVASHDAALVSLDVLPDSDAHELLVSRLGARRTTAEPEAVDQIVATCGGLPLALSITVGRAQEHPGFPLASLAGELSDSGSALNALDVDGALSVRAVLSTSYAALSAEQAEVFTLLGLIPGFDFSLEAAASLIGRPDAATRVILRALERWSLIQQHKPGRFRMHDLVKAYAHEQAVENLGRAVRNAAVRRFVLFYLHTMVLAEALCEPAKPRIAVGSPPEGCHPVPLRTADQAVRWFDLEAQNVVAAQNLAVQYGPHTVVWQFALRAGDFNARLGRHHDALACWRAGLPAAEILGENRVLAALHRCLASTTTHIGHYYEALCHGQTALELAEKSGNVIDKILALLQLTEVHWRMRRADLAAVSSTLAWQIERGQPQPIQARIAARERDLLSARHG